MLYLLSGADHRSIDQRIHTSQTRLPSPITRKSNGSPNRRLRLSGLVGHVPHSLMINGLSAPPTTPLAKP
jgi:hypothetical protein